jgi:hypothetical protein
MRFLAGSCHRKVACTREDPGTLIGPGSLSPDRWIYGGGWAIHHPALIQRAGGPIGSSNESTHRGPSRAALITCLPWPVVTEGSGRPTQPAHHAGESAASLPMPPGTERCQLGGGGSSQDDADCWRHRKPLPARYFGRGLLQRIAIDHGCIGDRRPDRLQQRCRDLGKLIRRNDE